MDRRFRRIPIRLPLDLRAIVWMKAARRADGPRWPSLADRALSPQLATNVAFCLGPDDTSNRLDCVHTMLLACIGFQYVLQSFLPPQPQQSFLDKYVIWSLLFVLGVGVQSIIGPTPPAVLTRP